MLVYVAIGLVERRISETIAFIEEIAKDRVRHMVRLKTIRHSVILVTSPLMRR